MSMPPDLMAALQGGGGPPGPPPGPAGPPPGAAAGPDGQGADPLGAVQDVVNSIYSLMALLPDADHTAQAHQGLGPFLKIQRDLMQGQRQGGAAGALRNRLAAG